MQTRSRLDAAKRCLFGGTLLAAGLASPEAQAQTLEFIDSTVSAHAYGESDSFSGAGTWDVEALDCYFSCGHAFSSGTPTGLDLYAYGFDDIGMPNSEVSVLSKFMVTSDASVTLYYYFDAWFDPALHASLTLTDLTNDVTVYAWDEDSPEGTLDIQLFAGTLYELSSSTDSGYASMTLIPAPPSAALLGLVGLVGRRRRRT